MRKITRMVVHKNNSGQALLFVVVALAISMVVGVSISTRTLSLSRRVSNTDTHSRVYYSAEAGIERFVNLSMDELEAIANNTDCAEAGTGSEQNDDGSCTFDLGDDIETSTEVTVEGVNYNETVPVNHFALDLGNGSFGGINLNGIATNRIYICWKNPQSAVYYSIWYSNGIRYKGILIPQGSSMTNITGAEGQGGTNAAYSAVYPYCYTRSIAASPIYLMVAPINAPTKIGVFPRTGSLPPQGYRITSKARLKSDDTNQVQVTKVIEVVRSFDYVPGFFDNAIYAQGSIREED